MENRGIVMDIIVTFKDMSYMSYQYRHDYTISVFLHLIQFFRCVSDIRCVSSLLTWQSNQLTTSMALVYRSWQLLQQGKRWNFGRVMSHERQKSHV